MVYWMVARWPNDNKGHLLVGYSDKFMQLYVQFVGINLFKSSKNNIIYYLGIVKLGLNNMGYFLSVQHFEFKGLFKSLTLSNMNNDTVYILQRELFLSKTLCFKSKL